MLSMFHVIGQDHAACCHPLLNIPVASAKANVQPDPVAHDLRRQRAPSPGIADFAVADGIF
jgi:hypothetical protein